MELKQLILRIEGGNIQVKEATPRRKGYRNSKKQDRDVERNRWRKILKSVSPLDRSRHLDSFQAGGVQATSSTREKNLVCLTCQDNTSFPVQQSVQTAGAICRRQCVQSLLSDPNVTQIYNSATNFFSDLFHLSPGIPRSTRKSAVLQGLGFSPIEAATERVCVVSPIQF